MSKKQLIALFLVNVVALTVGNGLVPLLPIYAAELGATLAMIGYYLAFSYLALVAGTIAAGWLSDRLGRRKSLLIVALAVASPAIWLMGRATNIWQLAALHGTSMFLFGVGGTLTRILTGLFAEEAERGRIFGIISMTVPLGALIGGAISGPMADRWGYPTMFAIFSLVFLLCPLTGLILEDKVTTRVRQGQVSVARERRSLRGAVVLLLAASLAATITLFVNQLGRSLAMDELEFPATAVSSTMAIGGAVALPLPLLLGWFSDRVGRKRSLAFGYLVGTAGLLVLSASVSLWQFWIAAALSRIMDSANNAVGSALVTDLVPEESLGRGLSLFGAMTWIGAIVGYASTGQVAQEIGLIPTFLVAAFLPLIATFLLVPIRQARRVLA
jgi:SET family sugar efflux transporter-like MFS transporter